MSLHYAATGTRTLCGRPLSDRIACAQLWPEFLAQVGANEDLCCAACLRACKGWQRFSRDLAIVRSARKRSAPSDG